MSKGNHQTRKLFPDKGLAIPVFRENKNRVLCQNPVALCFITMALSASQAPFFRKYRTIPSTDMKSGLASS
jgi:hypothetical protein